MKQLVDIHLRSSESGFISYEVTLSYSAVNAENGEMNKVRNQLNGQWGPVPDTARFYKVKLTNLCSFKTEPFYLYHEGG